MISDIATNLLFIQTLITQKIINQQDIDEYKFFKDDEIIAKGKQHDKTSFLSWVQDKEALYEKSAMLVNKINEIVNKIVKNFIKIARKRRSVINAKLLH